MRSVSMSILVVCCSLVLAASGLAQMNQPGQQSQQDQPSLPSQPSQPSQQVQEQQVQEQQAREQQMQEQQVQEQYAQQLMEPDELMGMRVHDAQGNEIGTVDQIVLDAMNGRIGYIVVSSGGFFSMGSEESIIPWSAVQFHPSRQQQQEQQEEPFLMVNMPKERLLAAPHGNVQDLDRRYAELVHDYYGVAPYWQETREELEQADQQRQQPMPPAQQQPSAPAPSQQQ